MNSSGTLFIPQILSANMISLLPISSHTTFLIPVRIQHMCMVIHLPFLFTVLFLETGETYRPWLCIFSHVSHQQFLYFSQLVAWHRACPPITFSMTTELHSGSNLHLSVMRTKSSSHLEIPALTTGWHKHLTSELCKRTKECRFTSWQMPFEHNFYCGTGLKSNLIPKNLLCVRQKTWALSSLQPFHLISHLSWESLS